jgi:hypothetical protein
VRAAAEGLKHAAQALALAALVVVAVPALLALLLMATLIRTLARQR